MVACGSSSNETDTATGAESEEPREICDRYLVCIAAVAPSGLPAAQMGFGDDGSCWQGSDKDAQLCIDACDAGLEMYHELFPDQAKCDLCQGHDDCDQAAGELCYQGECTVTTCGNGVVEAEEICDSARPDCDADCQGLRRATRSRGTAASPTRVLSIPSAVATLASSLSAPSSR
ncbi:hypothetical protein OV079_28460 [Nannocystis pusilla]|uniref:Uncharacterized protein n=1 Tax=Nannocystis pusilla TaxID=889268 RepID=A0A9X3F147_9BACT|nr:hypothetical protein [Nannocystis pusilla]MCY1009426.1 hypothetical protein [Nannocystis pusilla]